MKNRRTYLFARPISHSESLKVLKRILLRLEGSRATVFDRRVMEVSNSGISSKVESLCITEFPDCSLGGRIYLPCGEEVGFVFESSCMRRTPYRGVNLNLPPPYDNSEKIERVVKEVVRSF